MIVESTVLGNIGMRGRGMLDSTGVGIWIYSVGVDFGFGTRPRYAWRRW